MFWYWKKDIFPFSHLNNNIWNILDYYYYEGDCFETNVTDISDFNSSEIMSSLIWNYWEKREEYINTDDSVTGYMLCVIPHIQEDVLGNANG